MKWHFRWILSAIVWLYCVVCSQNLRSETPRVTPETTSLFNKTLPTVDSKLVKKAINPKIRLLFVAGLEGTGHHAVCDMLTVCIKSKKCEKEEIIGGACMRYDGNHREMYGLFGAAGSNNVMDEVTVIENRMNDLLKLQGDHLFYIGLKSHEGSGMMSYPNFEGKDKPLDYPDVFALAMIAESVGLDFRILVLQRSAHEIIESTSHRGFGGALGVDRKSVV